MKKAIKIDQGSKLALNKMEREGRSINRHADRTDCQEQRLKVSKIPWLDDIISRRGGTKGRNIANGEPVRDWLSFEDRLLVTSVRGLKAKYHPLFQAKERERERIVFTYLALQLVSSAMFLRAFVPAARPSMAREHKGGGWTSFLRGSPTSSSQEEDYRVDDSLVILRLWSRTRGHCRGLIISPQSELEFRLLPSLLSLETLWHDWSSINTRGTIKAALKIREHERRNTTNNNRMENETTKRNSFVPGNV